MNNLSTIYRDLGNYEQVIEGFQEAFTLRF